MIRLLIREARINILGLDWRHFCVAVDQHECVIGCGQIKQHKDGWRELASIAVEKSWQGRGVASAIIRNLIRYENKDLWLMCGSSLVPFYDRFGFREVFEPLEMPLYFRRIQRLWLILVKVTMMQRMLSFMLMESPLDESGGQAREIKLKSFPSETSGLAPRRFTNLEMENS